MKKVKLKDVADSAGVSLATVSRVINRSGYVSEEVRQAVLKAVEKTGYELPTREEEKPSDRRLIGVILKRLPSNLFFAAQNEAYIREAKKRGLQVITSFCDQLDNATLQHEAEQMMSFHVCGLIISGFQEHKLVPELKEYLMKLPVAVVFVERLADSQGLNQVVVDNFYGGYLAARHLIEQGHRKIVYIGRGNLDTDSTSSRFKGFLKAIDECSNPPEYYAIECDTPGSDAGYYGMERADREFPGYTAVQVWHDGYAVGVLQYLYDHHVRVPEDVEVVGHDDTHAMLTSPPITSVHLPIEEMAVAAVRIVADWASDSSNHIVSTVHLEPKLVVRGVKQG